MGLGPSIYLQTEADATSFVSRIEVESVYPKDERNYVGLVEGWGPTSNRMFITVGGHIRQFEHPRYPICISFNFYDAKGPWEPWIDDLCVVFDEVVTREDVSAGYLEWDAPRMVVARWSDGEALLVAEDTADLGIAAEALLHIRETFLREGFSVGALECE